MALNGSQAIGKYTEMVTPPGGHVFLTDQTCLSYFGRRSFSEQFIKLF